MKIVLMFAFVIVAGNLLMVFYMSEAMKDKVIETAQEKLKSDLAMSAALLDEIYPGPWHLSGDQIFKGGVLLNENYAVVDLIGSKTGGTVTIFRGDTRVATNVKLADGTRAVGTKVSDEVARITLMEGRTYIGEAEVAGVINQTMYEPIKDAAGKVIGMLYVGVPNTPYEITADEFKQKTLAFGALQMLIALGIALFFSSRLANSIVNLKKSAESIAEGDLSISPNIDRQDEIGSLSRALNRMVQNLHDMVVAIDGTANQLSVSSKELLSASEESSAVSQQMAEAMTSIARGAANQSQEIASVSAVFQQLTQATQQLTNAARAMAAAADDTEKVTKEGALALEKSMEQMKNISRSTEYVSDTINKLTISSKKINDISGVISGIADQTNLLALNAAIEAARAGEAGRGFAVVAEEVRKLAEQSQEATKQIATLVNDNHAHIEKANQAIKDGEKDVLVGIDVANAANTAFAEVERLTTQLIQQIQEVTAVIHQIASGNQDLVSAVEKINTISQQTASQTETVSAGAEEQLASIQEISAAASVLASMGNSLQSHVGRFRL